LSKSSRLKVFFDGGCRPNPGAMEIAVVIGGRVHVLRDLGHGTNEDAEWLALIQAQRMALALGASDVVLLGDAAAVVGPASGTAKCRGAAPSGSSARKAARCAIAAPRIRRVKRAQNLAGIALAKLHPR
jgi:ribonuclease HI